MWTTDLTDFCPEVCPTHNEPVCGNDGVTYSNRCQLGLEACNNNDQLRAVHAGACVNGKIWIGKQLDINVIINIES